MNFNWCFFQYTSLDILDSQIPGDDVLSGGCSADAEINKTRLLLPNLVFESIILLPPGALGRGKMRDPGNEVDYFLLAIIARLAGKMPLSCRLGIDALCLTIKICFLSHTTNPLLTWREGKMAGY